MSNGVVGESVMGIGVSSIRISSIGVTSHGDGSGYGLDGGGNNLRDLMDRGGSLLGGQTSGLSISESGEEFGLGSSYGFIISKVGGGDLFSLESLICLECKELEILKNDYILVYQNIEMKILSICY